jgi:hypothetical protein
MFKDLDYWVDRKESLIQATNKLSSYNSSEYLILDRGIATCNYEIQYYLDNFVNDEYVNRVLNSLNKPKKQTKKGKK